MENARVFNDDDTEKSNYLLIWNKLSNINITSLVSLKINPKVFSILLVIIIVHKQKMLVIALVIFCLVAR